jgi:hypothetical protein
MDLTCTYCGKDHNKRDINGNLILKEHIDYIIESGKDDTWCICIQCKNKCDKKGYNYKDI